MIYSAEMWLLALVGFGIVCWGTNALAERLVAEEDRKFQDRMADIGGVTGKWISPRFQYGRSDNVDGTCVVSWDGDGGGGHCGGGDGGGCSSG